MKTASGAANPAPLGLLGFGLTTIMLNVHNLGLVPLTSAIVGLGIFVGGLAQVIAGLQEAKLGNTFGATAFTAYGCFWLALVAVWTLPAAQLAGATDALSIAVFLLLWGVFTAGMWVATWRLSRLLQIVFGTLTALFVLLATRDALVAFRVPSEVVGFVAGVVGVVCGLAAVYGALAQVINEVYEREVWPLG